MNPSLLLSVIVALSAAIFSNLKSKEYIRPDDYIPGSGDFFDSIASRYDLLNRIISLGMDQDWRERAISEALPASSLLDVSTGTADLAIAVAEFDSSIHVVGIDPSKEMLAKGRQKIRQSSRSLHNLKLLEGVAETLPFEDNSFDAVVCAFGVRNFQNRQKGLTEMTRVLKKGGRMVILELSMPAGNSMFDIAARVFVKEVVPKLASLIAGKRDAYRYLSDSMDKFPRSDTFKDMLSNTGLSVQSHRRLAPLGQGPDLYSAVKR